MNVYYSVEKQKVKSKFFEIFPGSSRDSEDARKILIYPRHKTSGAQRQFRTSLGSVHGWYPFR